MMRTGFKRYIRRRAGADFSTQHRQGGRFSMRPARDGVPAFGNDCAIPDDHTTDPWVRGGGIQAVSRQLQRTRHEGVIGGGKTHGSLVRGIAGLTRGFLISRIASENSSTSSKLRYTEAKRI